MIFRRFSRAPVTFALLAIITVVFAWEWWTGAIASDRGLFDMGAIIPWGEMQFRGEYWRLIAAMFLHASILHWAANSWALYQLGTLFETMFGSARFALIYGVTGLFASIASSFFMHPNSVGVGASGAILGILGAFIFSIKRSPLWRNEPWTKNLITQLLFWAGVNIVLGMVVKNIDNVAHLAGMSAGLLLGLIPHRVPPPPPSATTIDITPHWHGSE